VDNMYCIMDKVRHIFGRVHYYRYSLLKIAKLLNFFPTIKQQIYKINIVNKISDKSEREILANGS
jgi:hypothetical protein